MENRINWTRGHQLWVELFALFNFGALSVDIYIAHSENRFRAVAEYIPLYFSIVATVLLLAGLALKLKWNKAVVWRDLGYFVGWVAVLVGLAGLILHLDSRFFYERTIKSLTYAAPFAAPLAFAGVGLVLIMNRMVDPASSAWARWLLLLCVGGFAGNFVFSLTDHAANGFFRPVEWLPVISSAFAVSFLITPFLTHVGRKFLRLCAGILGVQALIGVIGFILHLIADINGPGGTIEQKVVDGAPLLAPLLFPNLVLLALIALFVFSKHLADNPVVTEPQKS